MIGKRLPMPGELFKAAQKGPIKLNRGKVRTRFAPSPTGHLHLGSLRTALFNYLLARSTGGQFLLRLEDTDRKRLVPGAEESLYRDLRWCGINWDEGPQIGGPFGPYRQSERKEIYRKYADILLKSNHAYECDCSKERLDALAESARQLWPPSTASYDRRCLGSSEHAHNSILRFKSPEEYPSFVDHLHGKVNIQPQKNLTDIRYDDFALLKSDGMPTYHFANVVDDHLMGITHVVRGEEWLPSTPKHVALYRAFGWEPPEFIHLPLLTGEGGKKLSKRRSDTGIKELAEKGILPEALVNFVALLGWSPHLAPGTSEVMKMADLESRFSLDGLTKGNVQVDMSKLAHFELAHTRKLSEEAPELLAHRISEVLKLNDELPNLTESRILEILFVIKSHISSVSDFISRVQIVYKEPLLKSPMLPAWRPVLKAALTSEDIVKAATAEHPKKIAFPALRYALLDSQSGISIPEAVAILGPGESRRRVNAAVTKAEEAQVNI